MKMRMLLGAMVVGVTMLCAFAEPPMVRKPVGAGPLYPADPATLKTTVGKLFEEAASGQQPQGRVYALIAPHGGYGLCGKVDASAYACLQPRQYDRVIILAPSHFASFEGCSIPMVKAFQTPLGTVPLDAAAIRTLSFSPLVTLRSLNYGGESSARVKFQEYEYSIEVQLPFLQERLGQFMLVPILVGTIQDTRTQFRKNEIIGLAETFMKVIDDRTLIVVASDFTAYGEEYQYAPFKDNIPQNIEQIDRMAFDIVCAKDMKKFAKYLKDTGNTISATDALYLLMQLLPENAKGTVLSYVRSGDLTKQYTQSVSYAAIAFSDPAAAPTPQRPVEKEADFLRSIGWELEAVVPGEDQKKGDDAAAAQPAAPGDDASKAAGGLPPEIAAKRDKARAEQLERERAHREKVMKERAKQEKEMKKKAEKARKEREKAEKELLKQQQAEKAEQEKAAKSVKSEPAKK